MRQPCWFPMFATGALLMLGVMSGASLHAQSERFVFAITQEGQVLGIADADIAKFLGVPYAAAPIGAARWRGPGAPLQRADILTANKFGPSCPQASMQIFEPPAGNSEDCLTLNIFTLARMDERLPVMIWIHGGGLISGTGGDPLYDGSALAREGVTVVTLNYRLGALGWLASGSLSREDDGIGNYGMRDQIAALRWVHDNISAFGGDPDNITIFGSSSGANAVARLLVSRRATGLFQKAIIQSASFRELARDRNAAESATRAFAKGLGVSEAEMRQSNVQKILGLQKKQAEDPGLRSAYTIDGAFVDGQLLEAIGAGREQHIPLLIGSNGFPYAPDAQSMPETPLHRLLPTTAQLYPDSATQKDAPAKIRADWVFAEPTRFVARKHAGHGAATYRYLFNYVSERADPPEEGEEGHEIRFVFGTLDVRAGPYSRRDRNVSNTMRTYWTNFAKRGDPNGPDVPAWRPQSAQDDLLVISNSGIACGPDPMKARLDLMEQITSRQ